MDATTTRASTVIRSIPTREILTQASITIPLSSTRSRTSIRLEPPDTRSTAIEGLLHKNRAFLTSSVGDGWLVFCGPARARPAALPVIGSAAPPARGQSDWDRTSTSSNQFARPYRRCTRAGGCGLSVTPHLPKTLGYHPRLRAPCQGLYREYPEDWLFR